MDAGEQTTRTRDEHYNLISVLYQSADAVETLKTYVQDAEQEGDQELIDFFNPSRRDSGQTPTKI